MRWPQGLNSNCLSTTKLSSPCAQWRTTYVFSFLFVPLSLQNMEVPQDLPSSPALQFEVIATCGRARSSRLTLPHFTARTPMFMPVGTQGTVKGLTAQQLEETNAQVILSNTYHIGNAPGPELLAEMGGLHKLMGWKRGLLTDSGGFQMVSLLDLADITEEGVEFQSPTTGERMLLTPERSMAIQNAIGADIIMALDDVVSSVHVGPERFEEATHRTLRWIDRCIAAHSRPGEQNLFAIVQGGLDVRLRDICLKGLAARDAHLPGYAIGGLAGGEDKGLFWRVIDQCTAALPAGKPRYVMGVGYPLDIVVCSCLGADMYGAHAPPRCVVASHPFSLAAAPADCVYPTRTARFGTALVPEGTLRLRQACHASDPAPIDATCACLVCRTYSRAYLHAAATREPRAAYLISYHNLFYMQRFTAEMRAAIEDGTLPRWVRAFVEAQRPQMPGGVVPDWVVDALAAAGIPL